MSEELLGTQAAADYLGISAATLRNYRRKNSAYGGPRFYKHRVTGRVYYRASELAEWKRKRSAVDLHDLESKDEA